MSIEEQDPGETSTSMTTAFFAPEHTHKQLRRVMLRVKAGPDMGSQSTVARSRITIGRSAVNDLVLAEMFLVQATIESASIVGERLSEYREDEAATREFRDFLKETGEQVIRINFHLRFFVKTLAGDAVETPVVTFTVAFTP